MRNNYENQLKKINRELKRLPEGKLTTSSGGKNGNIKYFLRTDSGKEYIKKENYELICQLALKRYLLLRVKELKTLIYAESMIRNAYKAFTTEINRLTSENSNYHDVMIDALSNYTKSNKQWSNLTEEANNYNSHERVVPTLSGIFVRSKSESMIANELTKNNIPFKYEISIRIGDKSFYPDFAIYSYKDEKIYLWEHWGLMDNESYRTHAFNKIGSYIDHGIFPDDNLIMTYESKNHPLDIKQVEKIIRDKFL